MKATHPYLFKTFSTFAFGLVYNKPPQEVVSYEPGSGEKEKSLSDTLREAEEAVKNADQKLKKIEDFYGFVRPNEVSLKKISEEKSKLQSKKKLDPKVADAYFVFLNRWYDLKKALTEAKKYASKTPDKIKSDQDVIDKTIADLESFVAGFRDKQKSYEEERDASHKGDPVHGIDENLHLDESPLVSQAPKQKGGTKEKSPPKKISSSAEKQAPTETKEPPKNSQEYWMFQITNVVKKLLSGQGVTDTLSADEKKAIMFFCNPGKSRDFVYKDQGLVHRVTLQRDITGKYLRVLGGQPNSYVAFQTGEGKKPEWPKDDSVQNPVEKYTGLYGKEVDWLKSPKTTIGSRVYANVTLARRKDGNVETFEKLYVELVKSGQNMYRVILHKQNVEKEGKKVRGGEVTDIATKDFSSLSEAVAYAREHFTSEVSFSRINATPEETAKEEAYALEKQRKKLELHAGRVIRSMVPILNQELMAKYSEQFADVLRDLGIKNWKSSEQFIGRFTLRVIEGEMQVIDLQPGGIGTPKGKKYEAIAYRKPVNYEKKPESALA